MSNVENRYLEKLLHVIEGQEDKIPMDEFSSIVDKKYLDEDSYMRLYKKYKLGSPRRE